MRIKTVLATVMWFGLVSGCASTGDGAAWKCQAQGLVNASYDGGDYAHVHLQGFTSGGRYQVKRNAQGTEATGTTANGTPFKCVKAG